MRAVAAILCLALSSLTTLAKEEKVPRRDRDWVAAQLASWDLTRPGAPPFRLVAKLEVLAQSGSWVTGSYALIWAAPDRWREEIRFPGHEEIEALGNDIRWHQRPTRYRPRLAWLLTSMVRSDRFPPKEPREFRQTKPKNGRPALACIGETCVDTFTGELRSGEIYTVAIAFDPPAAFPLRTWPAAYRAMEDRREIGRATIEVLEPLGTTDAAAFAPPAGAAQVPSCAAPTAPHATAKAKPPYPSSLVDRRIEGKVRLRATIAEDGTVQDIEVSRTPHPELATLALETVRNWRYVPGKCGQRAVPIEVWVSVDWSIGTGIPK